MSEPDFDKLAGEYWSGDWMHDHGTINRTYLSAFLRCVYEMGVKAAQEEVAVQYQDCMKSGVTP